MPHTYTLDVERRIVLSVGTSTFSDTDAFEHYTLLRSDPQFCSTFRQLWDFSQVTEVVVSNITIRQLAANSIFAPEARRAFLVSSDLAFGLGRMFATLQETLRESPSSGGVQVFRDRAAALIWLEAD